MNKRIMLKNVSISIIAQIISLIVAIILNLVVPKFISELQYSNWQTYVLYSGYVGVLHLGLLDGIILRYSEFNYSDLNKPLIRSQFQILFYINACICLLFFLLGSLNNNLVDRTIGILVAIAIVTKNLFTYNSYLFQLTNRIKYYAILVISQKLGYGFLVIILLINGVQEFWLYCVADLMGDLVSHIIVCKHNKGLYFGKTQGFINSFQEAKKNISCGIMLLIATWSSMLLIGSSKMIVQWNWDKIIFGKVSFSFSVATLFLTFVSAISVVLFPSLKRMDDEELPGLYYKIRAVLSPILLFALLLYFPGAIILEKWLPGYTDSITYLGVLLPTIVFTSKVSLLTNNYLKAYRKERVMFSINVASVFIAVFSYLICAYLFNNINMLLNCVVIIIMGRSIVSEIVVSKIININLIKEFTIESIITFIFIIVTQKMNIIEGFTVYLIVFIIYLSLNKNIIKFLVDRLLRRNYNN